MGCVNRNGKEFKDLASKHNLDSNTLELMVHKYWLETGSEAYFPTDVYIQAQLGNTQYQEDSKNVRKLWQMAYNVPKEFSTLGECQKAYNEATRYFPKSAIVYYKNDKGNFVLSVKKPVARLSYSKEAYLKDMDNMVAPKNGKTLNLDITEGQTYGIGKVQELYNKFNTDKTSQDLADRVFNLAKDLGINVNFTENIGRTKLGNYVNTDNTINYRKSFLEGIGSNEQKANILLHEAIHAITSYALSDNTANWERPKDLEKFRIDINSIYQDLKNNPLLRDERGIVNVKEFVAELSNPVFRAKIQEIDKQNKRNKPFWSRVLDAFKKLLGLHVTNNYYERSMNALDKALNAFDIDSYMRYTGMKSKLRESVKGEDININNQNLKQDIKDAFEEKTNEKTNEKVSDYTTNIKPQYRGKLIYGASGTGKSTIADNKTVFDSDYILGEILGVSPETAEFFFQTLSSKQKKAFGEKYKEAIKEKVSQGYTVLTANASLLNDADVIVYNQSPELTDERVNSEDRAYNNRYNAISYHQDTLSKIKDFKANDKNKNKEYIELDRRHYLGDYILSSMGTATNIHTTEGENKSNSGGNRGRGRYMSDELDSNQFISDFLNKFGITVHLLNNYDGELPLFDALNRVINAKDVSDITEGVGYAIAFMMQGDPEMQKIITSSLGFKGDYSKRVYVPFAGMRTLKQLHPTQWHPVAKEALKEVGRQITSELRSNFNIPLEEVKSGNKVWTIIKNFFKKIGMSMYALGKRTRVKQWENLFVKDIIEALGREDFSRIRGPRIKEGSTEKATRVDVETALKENPFEDNIIRKLGEHDIALAGSTSIALEGSLYRPSENPLHDIDFNAGDHSSKKQLLKLLPTIFGKDNIAFASEIKKRSGNNTVTFVMLNVPFETRNRDKKGYHAEYYSTDGKYLGKKEGSELYLEDGVKGKLLDFFVGKTQESNYGFYTKVINGHRYLLSNSNAAMAAKVLWARPKDMWDYKNFKRDSFEETTREFIASISDKQLRDELSLTKREEDDYDLVNGIEEEPQKRTERTGPQDFTFNDGTTIEAPFKPNDQQVEALNAMDDFVKSDETSMTLSGYAGTGKTSIMEMIAKKCRKNYIPVQFCASTNKAAAVLNEKVSKVGFKATTVNKMFGIRVEVDPNQKHYDAKKMVNVVKPKSIMPGTTVIIDEASMINEENYNILNQIARMYGLKIIYVGDSAQLPPVNENQISKVFRNGDGKVITLTQVERTDDNAILKEATALRNDKPLSGESSFNSKGEGVAYISPEHVDAINEVISHYAQGLKEDPNYFRILAYTNDAVAFYNAKMRQVLGHTSAIPQKGEPMMGYANWGYDDGVYRFINSESYKVMGTGNPKKVGIWLGDGTYVSMETIPLTLEDSMGNKDVFDFMDIKANLQNREAATLIAHEKQRLWGEYKKAQGKYLKSQILSRINELEQFLFLNDNIEETIDGKKVTLQSKTIDFGYAMTTHKSQGSTFTNVLIDDVDISTADKSNKKTQDTNNTNTIEADNGKTYDMGTAKQVGDLEEVDWGSDIVGGSEDSNQALVSQNKVDLRQQLEYVAVSRATDTATIISDDVKREGSPLHPEDTIEKKPTAPTKSTSAPAKETSSTTPTLSLGELETKIQSDSQKMKLSDDEKYYVDEEGNKYARVTSVITTEDSRFDPSSPWALPSSKIGTGVDVFVRDFFDGKIGDPNSLALRYPNAKQQYLRKLYDDLQQIKDKINGRFTVVPKDVTLKGTVSVTDKDGKRYRLNIAGTVDLLIYDDKGNFFIYDMKTHHFNKEIYKDPAKLEKYTKQVSLYKTLFENQYPGNKVKGLALMPIHVSYPSPKGWYDGTAEYSAKEGSNQLLLNGKEFRGADPTLEKTIPITPQNVEIHYEDLTDEAKALAVPENDTTNQAHTNEVARQLTDHLKSMGINVLGKEDMQKFFNEHPGIFLQMARAFGKEMPYLNSEHREQIPKILNIVKANKYNKPGTDAVTLDSDNHKVIYLIDHSADKELADNLKKGDGFGIRKVFNVENIGENDIREIVRNIAPFYDYSPARVRHVLQTLGIEEKHLSKFNLDDEIKRAVSGNNAVHGKSGQGQSTRENGFGGYYDNSGKQGSRDKGDLGQKASSSVTEDGTEFFLTPQGEIYGFVDKDGNIYLDETKISPEHPIHEYTHLWDRAVAKNNPELWNRGVELMKQTSLWNDVLNDENYGKKWQALKGMTSEKMNSLIASEVHSLLTGKKGAEILDKLAKEKGQSGIIAKLKQWVLDVWKSLKNTFSPWTKSELEKLTLDDFNNMAVRDFTKGINPLDAVVINSTKGTANDPQRFNNAIQSKNVIESDHTILSNDELKYWNEQGVGEMPRIISASEHSDPAFHVGEILSVIEGKRPLYTWDHKTLTGKDFAGMYIITKHDGLPMRRLLETKIPKLIHFSITGLGGTEYEPGVMKYNDLLDRIQEYIEQGLDPKCVTIRIDPIIPGITKNSDIETIVKRASEMGIKRIRFSVMDAYTNTVAAISKLGYDFETYYGRKANGEINFHAKYEVLNSVADFMLSLKEKYGVTMGTCAEPMVREGINKEGCLSVAAVNNLLGTHIIDKKEENNKSRHRCTCYGGKVDALKYGANCASHCVYCYARHENDRAMQYYNEDGTLKDNNFTRTSWSSAKDTSSLNTNDTSKSYSWATKSDNGYEVSTAGDKRFSALNATFKPGTTVKGVDVSGRTIEDAYQHLFKRSGKGRAPAKDSILYLDENKVSTMFRGFPEGVTNVEYEPLEPLPSVTFKNSKGQLGMLKFDSSKERWDVYKQQKDANGNDEGFFYVNLSSEKRRGFTEKFLPKELLDLTDSLEGLKTDTEKKEVIRNFQDTLRDKYNVYNIQFYNESSKSKEERENFSYKEAYLPLWQEWAKQNPQLMEELKVKAQGKVLTDKFANTSVSQARALSDILNADTENTRQQQDNSEQNYQMKQPENNVKQEEKVQNPLIKEEKTYSISLSNYRYFGGKQEDTQVNALWKIPSLKKLDERLSKSNTDKENQAILDKMNDIMSTSLDEKEYKDSSKRNAALSDYKKLIKQMDTLLNGHCVINGEDLTEELDITPIKAWDVRHTAELIVNGISDEIDRLQTEEGRAKKIFPNIKTDLDFHTATRRQIVDTIGINTLLERAKYLFDSETAHYDNDDESFQADLITDNWDAFVTLAADIFALNEGFGITRDYSIGSFATTDETKIDHDNFNDYSNDPDVRGEEGERDEQEHWMMEMKTIDVLNSMSDLVRQGLRKCYLIDENGEKVMSRWGIAERVNPRKATNSILRWTQGSTSLGDMIAKLSDKSKNNPWLSQLIEMLSDTSGKYTDFQSQFYGVFSKPFQLYSIGKAENGKYSSMMVNSHPALTDAMRSITAQFRTQTHPLFTGNMVKKELLGSETAIGEKDAFSLHKALKELQEVDEAIRYGKTDKEAYSKAQANIVGVCRLLGFDVTEDMVADVLNDKTIHKEMSYLTYLVNSLDKVYEEQRQGKHKDYNPFKFGEENGIDGTVKNFLTPITDVMEDTAVSAFYDSGKMYQSYITPSFMTKLMDKFHQQDENKFDEFMMSEYGSSEWFNLGNKDLEMYHILKGTRGTSPVWRNSWLDQLWRNKDARDVFSHKVELNFNKHNYMRNMTDAEYTLSLLTNYFAEKPTKRGQSLVPAWFRVPMQSNKPSSDFIKFYSYRGESYKHNIVNDLHNMFLQELSRIQTVRMRNLSKKDAGYIKNFDSNGLKFCFLPVFNAYLENTPKALANRGKLHNTVEFDENRLRELEIEHEAWKKGDILGSFDFNEYNSLLKLKEANDRALNTEDDARFATLLQKKLNGEALSEQEEVQFGNLADRIIRQFMENRMQSILNKWENKGILKEARSIDNIYNPLFKGNDKLIDLDVRDNIENFLWNDALASKNILQLTVGDIAFYKDTEDLQKRLAQLHAPGVRARLDAIDYNGNRVSDGIYRTFILKDFDTFMSNIIANISEVFDRRIAAATSEDMKRSLMNLKDSLVRPRTYNEDGSIKDKGGKYWNINVADAQGYSSPSSYRKKTFMFGKWSHEAEDIYQKLLKGDYNFTDLKTAFQPLKPFVYTHLTKDLGVADAPIKSMQVPFQAKNAEYLLIMADAMLQGEELSRPNLLRAVYRVMEESEKINPTMGIDTVQFESAIKSGLQGAIDLNQFLEMPGGEEAAYSYMRDLIYKKEYNQDSGERIYKNYNKDVYVHEASYDGYCLQQEVPEHFKDHSQAHGSQIRMITPSDLDFYTNDVDKDGNPIENTYSFKEPDGTVKNLNAKEFRHEYEKTISDGIEESISLLEAELHLNTTDRKERNIALSQILIKEILSSPRYGVDLMQACSLDENGEFRIPKGDPIQAKRIEQLINSIIKNRVNKQKIAGGPIVQVSNYGISKQLHIRFNDKQGNLLPLEEEYKPSEHNGKSYKDYIHENQGGIAYFEVLAPVWSDELVEKFGNQDGSINVAVIETTDPELLKMVSYRIPTEDKYSCAPMKVVGFMPREAGDAIMLPYELTEIDDSDFDVDKRYVMRKDIPIKTKRRKDIEEELFKRASESYKNAHDGKTADRKIGEQVRMFMDNPQRMKDTDSLMRWLYRQYQSIAYYTDAPTSGRQYRDNKIVDMTYAVLTNQMTADKILNPGGFDEPKRMGYMVTARKNHPDISWSKLKGMSVDELKDLSYTDKDLTFADTQIQFYKQNAAASSLIGVFAVNKVAHAVLEGNGVFLDVNEICGYHPFKIMDTTFDGKMEVDGGKDSQGNLIGKTLGSLVSASADAVKDPILNLMNINMTTVNVLGTMLRLGMPFNDAALFLSQDIIGRLLDQFNRENLSNYVSLDSLIYKWLDSYRKKNGITEESPLNTESLSEEELVKGLTSDEHEEIDFKVLLAFQKLRNLAECMRNITFATRFNSISSAVGPLIVDNLITEHKMESFDGVKGDTHFYTKDDEPYNINNTFKDHPVLNSFSKAFGIARDIFSDMPTGSNGFRGLLNSLPKDISDRMYTDKKLLDQFSLFYQSYLLLESGVIDPSKLNYYIKDFPKEFMKKHWDKKYPDNALIKAIRMNVNNKSENPYLIANITGMDEQQKEELKYGWIDLHKDNPQLSQDLFNYSFFRAGIGFSPKTFMALVPTYVKERIKGYVDTYRNFPNVVSKLVIDQFVANNWDNNKLAPWKGGKNTHYIIDEKNGTLLVNQKEEMSDVEKFTYIKTSKNKIAYLWKQEGRNTEGIWFRRMQPLGNNGEYLEMSLNDISSPVNATTKVSEDNTPSQIRETSPQEVDLEIPTTPEVPLKQAVKNVSELIDLIMRQVPKFSREKAESKVEEMKGNPKPYGKFLQNVFKQKGLDFNEKEALDEFKKYC